MVVLIYILKVKHPILAAIVSYFLSLAGICSFLEIKGKQLDKHCIGCVSFLGAIYGYIAAEISLEKLTTILYNSLPGTSGDFAVLDQIVFTLTGFLAASLHDLAVCFIAKAIYDYWCEERNS